MCAARGSQSPFMARGQHRAEGSAAEEGKNVRLANSQAGLRGIIQEHRMGHKLPDSGAGACQKSERRAVSPPSTTSVAPVMYAARSEARKAHIWAMSDGWPTSPQGILAPMASGV